MDFIPQYLSHNQTNIISIIKSILNVPFQKISAKVTEWKKYSPHSALQLPCFLEVLDTMSNPKMIKTSCGINKYHQLQKDPSLWGKLRLIWFVAIATLRDFNK
jgi:hypothetical protein